MSRRSSEFLKMTDHKWLIDNQINELQTLREVAMRLKISVSGLRKIVARYTDFPKYKVGHQLRFSWIEVERYFRKGE